MNYNLKKIIIQSGQEAIELINEGQASGMNAVEWNKSERESKGIESMDPNRLGPCGKKTC